MTARSRAAGPTVWTIGHGTRSLEELVAALAAHGIEQLADVRTVPRSRHNPQFNRETLPDSLAAAGIAYVHLAGLGGLRRPRRDSPNSAWRNASFRGYADYMLTEEFARALDGLLELAGRHPLAVMCAERVPWRCHRSMIADALTARGVRVVHILDPERSEPHKLTPWARVEEGGRVTYPGQGELWSG